MLILLGLAVLAVSRSVASVAYKDVLGKTVAKGQRGTVTGLAGTWAAGVLFAFALGVDSGWQRRALPSSRAR